MSKTWKKVLEFIAAIIAAALAGFGGGTVAGM